MTATRSAPSDGGEAATQAVNAGETPTERWMLMRKHLTGTPLSSHETRWLRDMFLMLMDMIEQFVPSQPAIDVTPNVKGPEITGRAVINHGELTRVGPGVYMSSPASPPPSSHPSEVKIIG